MPKKVKETAASRPDFYNQFKSIRTKELAKKAKVTDEEMHLYSMSQSAGWGIFNKTVEQLLEELDGMNVRAMENGMSFEEIGRNTIIINYTKGLIKRLTNKVNDARDTVEQK